MYFNYILGVILAWMATCHCQGIEFVALNRENVYEYEGSVIVIAQTPWDQINLPQTAGWKIRGTVKLQCINEHTLAASVSQSMKMSLKQSIRKLKLYQLFQWNYE